MKETSTTTAGDLTLELPDFIRRRFHSLGSPCGDDEPHVVRLEGDDEAADAVVDVLDAAVSAAPCSCTATFANATPGVARALIDWRLDLLRTTHRAMSAHVDWFGPDEIDLHHRFPWPTVRVRFERAVPPSGVGLRIHTHDGGSIVVPTTGAFVPSDANPSRSVEFLSERTGLSVEPLRIKSADEFEFSEQGASQVLDGPRSSWQQPGWTRRLIEAVRHEVGARGVSLTGRFRTVRHSSVTCLCTVESSAGRLWIKVGHPVFTSEASFLLHTPAAARGELPNVMASGDGWFAMSDFERARPRPGTAVGTVLRLQEEFDAMLANGHPELDELLTRPLERLRTVVDDLDDLRWVPQQLRGALRLRIDELMAVLSDRAQSSETVTHGDLNAANIASVGGGFVVHDWTDVALAPAGVDLLTLDRSFRDPRVSAAVDEALARFGDSVGRARAVAAVTADAFQLVNYEKMIRRVDQTAADHSSGASLQSHFLGAASRLAFGPALL